MVFEKIIEVLTALVVAIAGIAGLNTAAEHADPAANDAALKAPSGLTKAEIARAEFGPAEQAAVGPADGLARALEALAEAMENAPEQAVQGLESAVDAVSESPANDAPAGPPEGVPAGPPEDLPGGRP
jgi:hypothetical protein